MRILLVNTRHFRGGGDSTYTLNLADLLQRNGHSVAFFGMQDSRNLPDVNSDLFVSHIDFRELNRHRSISAGLRVLARIVYSREARRKIGQLLNRFKPDIVHLQNIHAHITPSVIFEAKKRGLPVVWTLHDYKLICPNSHFWIDSTFQICEACGKHAYYQPIIKQCKKGSRLASGLAALEAYAHLWMGVRRHVDAYITASIFLQNKLIERGFSSEKIRHLPYFLQPEMFDRNDSNKGYILFVGRIEPIKGIYPLLAACHMVPEVRLILVGRADESLASRLSTLLPSNAQYMGVIPDEELRQLLRNALAVVVPSIVYESQPFSILEAFAMGKPVIASDLGGMKELVIHQKRGLVIPPGNIEALARSMHWMVTNPQKAYEMGQSAQRYAADQHNPERHYQRLMDIYSHIGGKASSLARS
jgi:glycosyltransferase involved in cell wall biosynthesis